MEAFQTADDWIAALNLIPHPEGGYFSETYRSSDGIPAAALEGRFPGARVYSTGAYFLLRVKQFSAFHRLRADELWHYYAGLALRLFLISEDGALQTFDLGLDYAKAQLPQRTVSAGTWVAARPLVNDLRCDFSLCGCTVAPGFEFEDFELAEKATLSASHPEHSKLIHTLCNA